MKRIVIIGAGKIGRGFVADVFVSGGYRPVFVDASSALVNELKSRGRYTLYNSAGFNDQEKIVFTEFDVLHADDPAVPSEIINAGLAAVSVFPDTFPAVAKLLADSLKQKNYVGDHTPLDIILLANVTHSQALLIHAIRAALPQELHSFMDEVLSVSGTIVIRVAVSPSPQMLAEDPLAVLTDGHKILPVENNFKGARPPCPALEFHDSLETLETLKLYTYNMAHAAAAYLGYSKGAITIAEALGDKDIEMVVRGALDEVLSAYIRSDNFDEDKKASYIDGVVNKFKNPLLGDAVVRVGANPKRKLGYDDRLIGAARAAREKGIYPYYLTKAAAYGFLFADKNDSAAMEIREAVMLNGIESAVRVFTGLTEPDLIYTIKCHYLKADGRFVAEDTARVDFIKKAYTLGFDSEKKYRGCAQGTLIALFELTGIVNKDVYLAATGFSGGVALCGDGVCGGYSAGVMFTGLLRGRDFDRMKADGDKVNQYAAYEASQRIHDRFEACYGSPICQKIHVGMFGGEHYILRTKQRRDEFELAGAHTVVCTTVVALASAWTSEIILDMDLYQLEKRSD